MCSKQMPTETTESESPSMPNLSPRPSANNDDDHDHDDDDKTIGSFETKRVYWIKTILFATLIAFTIAFSLFIHNYASRAEQTRFHDRFDDEANNVMEAVKGSLLMSLGAFDSFCLSMVAQAKSSNQSWPFVRISDFAVQAAKVRTFSKAIVLYQHILVQENQRAEWERFAAANDDWMYEGVEVQNQDPNFHGKGTTGPLRVNSQIHTLVGMAFGPSPSDGKPFLPSWQTYPVAPQFAPYNWDGARYGPLVSLMDTVLEKKQIAMRIANMDLARYTNLTNYVSDPDSHWGRGYISKEEDPTEPMMEIYYPISTQSRLSVTQDEESSADVVGVLTSSLYWRDFLKDILQPGTGSVTAVFQMRSATITYAIDGPDPIYLGPGDLHDHKYNSQERYFSFGHSDFRLPGGLKYTGLPLSPESAEFVIRVYPSSDMEEYFLTTAPRVYTVAAALAFAITSFLFVVYSLTVDRRQEKVLHTFLETEANISLLEEMVGKRTRELQETNRRLEAASAAQLQHFAAMSHEIRTPMNGIIGLSSLLVEETEMTPMQIETVKTIVSSGELLVDIVNDVLDYSKLESGFVDVVVEDSNLQEILDNTVRSVNALGKRRNVQLKTYYDTRVPEYCRTDPRRLRQILYNLLGNAIKFSKENTTVELRVDIGELKNRNTEICVNASACVADNTREQDFDTDELAQARRDCLRFVIKDFGRGIKQEDLQDIFKPFTQAGRDTSCVYGGTGLGLATTKKLVRALGGEIRVRSEFGYWSEFTVELPLLGAEPFSAETVACQLQKASILLVGPPGDEQERIIDLFGRLDIKMLYSNNLKEILRGHSYDLSQHNLCLIHECVYDKKDFDALRTSSSFITYGPSYSVKESRQHIRSLTETIPCALFRQLADVLDRSQETCLQPPELQPPEELPSQLARKLNSVSDDTNANVRFLIAEDNLVNQKVLNRILNRLGFANVDIVGDGQAAVEAEARQQYDVIWMDIEMPNMDGVAACRAINAREGGHAKPKIVFVTAHVQDHYKKKCSEAGGLGFLPKPCNIDRVKECLTKIA